MGDRSAPKMIDIQVVDAWFEASKDILGAPARFAVFDRRALLPLAQLASGVTNETAEPCTIEQLQKKAGEGWFPLLPLQGTSGEFGAPLYVPSRIGLYLRLERDGWSNSELRLAACLEEALIDATTIKDIYSDDDLVTIVSHLQERIDCLGTVTTKDGAGRVIDRSAEIIEDERILALVTKWREQGAPAARKDDLAKFAHRVRAQHEMVTLHMVEADRGKLRAGYGPTVHFRRWTCAGPDASYEPEHIDWDTTIRLSSAHADPMNLPTIRVEGFLLEGDSIRSTRTMRPPEYAALWDRCRIDQYLLTWAHLRGEKLCLHCLAPLPPDAKDSRRFCNERCRSAAKMKRHRRENPEAVLRAQERYWKS
jgi:predicted nucleic acid-binding Zn ribbon protein